MTAPDGTLVWLVRHGETEWSTAGRHTGRTDLPLTDLGRRQAKAIGDLVGEVKDAYVLCSPLERARDTAELAGFRVDAIDADLTEWDYGDYEGLTSAQIRADRPGWELWTDGAPGGERPDDVARRADRVLDRARQLVPARTVVLVAHGHICRMIAARWIGMAPAGGRHLLLGTAAPSLLAAQYGVPVIDRWNLPNSVQPGSANGSNGKPGD